MASVVAALTNKRLLPKGFLIDDHEGMCLQLSASILPSDFFRAEEHSIHSLLTSANRRFVIPEYQRNFAWTETELAQMWSDFEIVVSDCFYKNQLRHDARPHFFGAIVLTETAPDEYEVTDGQQRLTATTILLRCILDRVSGLVDPYKISGISSLITPLLQTNHYGEQFKKRLELDVSVDTFFEEYVLKKTSVREREEYAVIHPVRENTASSRIKAAVEFFTKRLMEAVPTSLSQEELHDRLMVRANAITRLFMVLKIVVKKKETAYVIFETLNKRGRDLSESDMIKNELFKSVPSSKHALVKTLWDEIVSNIEDENLTEYIRFHYASTYDTVRPSELFSVIKAHLQEQDPIDYLKKLHSESEWFARITLVGTAFWGSEVTEKLKAFKSINVGHSIPLLLTGAVMFNSDEPEFARLVNATLVFCFRHFTIGRSSVNDLEKEIGFISRSLRDPGRYAPVPGVPAVISTLDEAIKYMHGLTDDSVFQKKFGDFSTGSSQLAFYILYELERSLVTGVKPLPHGPGQHVEHIMPKTPSRAATRLHEWGHVRNDPNYKDYLSRLGNLLILESELNQKVRNKDFAVKKSLYAKSGLHYPKEIASSHKKWDFGTIERRQNQMAKQALETWSY